MIQVEPGLWVLLPPLSGGIGKGMVERLAIEARKDFDAIIFDLPNTDADCVMEAVSCSNALVMVATGQPQEMNRVLAGGTTPGRTSSSWPTAIPAIAALRESTAR